MFINRIWLIKCTFIYNFSYERVGAVPFQFQLGIGAVIKGWETGLLDMCVQEKRRLSVPSKLAYGEKGSGMIYFIVFHIGEKHKPVFHCFWVMVRTMVFNATFSNISVISWRSVLLVEETGVPKSNYMYHTITTTVWRRPLFHCFNN